MYPWFAEHGESLIHPDDRRAFAALFPYGKVFQCVGTEHNYLVLRYMAAVYRVRPDLYQKIDEPRFQFGQRIRVKSHPEREGTIRGIAWHFKNDSPMYFLQIAGKQVSKRYWAEDLEPITDETGHASSE